jgi:hypothetical protein
MTRQAHVKAKIVNDTALAQDLAHEQAKPFDGSSLLPMLIAGLVLTVVGMIAAFLLS